MFIANFLQLRDGLSKDNRNFRNREPVEEFNGKAGEPPPN
jgi:hypothetical protein